MLSIYVELGIPAMLGTLLVLSRALDLYERCERLKTRRIRQRASAAVPPPQQNAR